jgi:hypothetical protein
MITDDLTSFNIKRKLAFGKKEKQSLHHGFCFQFVTKCGVYAKDFNTNFSQDAQ